MQEGFDGTDGRGAYTSFRKECRSDRMREMVVKSEKSSRRRSTFSLALLREGAGTCLRAQAIV